METLQHWIKGGKAKDHDPLHCKQPDTYGECPSSVTATTKKVMMQDTDGRTFPFINAKDSQYHDTDNHY